MDASTCPICLEHFKKDYAHIPTLRCECAIIVHKGCWGKWSGECLYCREQVDDIQQIQIIQNNTIIYYHPTDIICCIFICVVIYLYIIIVFTK